MDRIYISRSYAKRLLQLASELQKAYDLLPLEHRILYGLSNPVNNLIGYIEALEDIVTNE